MAQNIFRGDYWVEKLLQLHDKFQPGPGWNNLKAILFPRKQPLSEIPFWLDVVFAAFSARNPSPVSETGLRFSA